MNIFTEYRRAKQAADQAQRFERKVAAELQALENRFRESLPVGDAVPCAVGQLPDGTLAVHVWVEGASEPNQIHFVRAGLVTEDGRPRIAEKG